MRKLIGRSVATVVLTSVVAVPLVGTAEAADTTPRQKCSCAKAAKSAKGTTSTRAMPRSTYRSPSSILAPNSYRSMDRTSTPTQYRAPSRLSQARPTAARPAAARPAAARPAAARPAAAPQGAGVGPVADKDEGYASGGLLYALYRGLVSLI